MPRTKKKIKEELPKRNNKEEKLFKNLLKTTEQFISGKGFVPLTQAELMERLRLPPQHESIFNEVLNALIVGNMIEFRNGRYSWKKIEQDLVKGVLHVHPRGFGFLQPEDPVTFPQDIFIPKHLTKNAVDGDVVEVRVNEGVVSEKGPEGRVVSILSRGRTHMAGTVRGIDPNGDIVAYVPLLGNEQHVVVEPRKDHVLQTGDRIVMEVLDWGTKETGTRCSMSSYIGPISDPSCDIDAAIEEYELRHDFPDRVIEEAKEFGTKVSAKDIREREDLRCLVCCTIDPDTAKDYDDALSLTKDERGHYLLGVHIADVSHYVKPGSALEEEASLRCNSTYFPGYCLPMLPSVLSDNLCSLKPNVNRLTVSVLMDFDPDANLVDYRITRSVIKSVKRFTYREAKTVIDGKKKSPHAPLLNLMVEICRRLKKKRYERGSIEFSMPELSIVVDDKGVPVKTDYIEYDITHQMVEEFMLKANELVALHLSRQGKNLTYRVHDEPAEDNLREFALLANAFGFKISDKPDSHELQQLFDEAMQTSYGQYLATNYIRRMRLAAYSPENIGHYGLGLTHYCHFTSPIRRYVDLVVHRILFGSDDDLQGLQLISDRCSEQERISAKAEGSVHLLKKLRLLKSVKDKEPAKQYGAIITRVKNFGIYFEIPEFMLEGFLHVSELDNDFFVYEEKTVRLKGARTGTTYCAGDRIIVMLKNVDFISLESDWYLVNSIPKERYNIGKMRTRPKKKRR